MSIKQNYLLNLANSIINIAFPLITFPYAARILDPTGIGEVQVIFSYAKYFAIIAAFGIPIYGIKVLAEDISLDQKRSRTVAELLLIGIISSVVMTVSFFIVANQLEQFQGKWNELLMASLLVLLSFLNTDWYFNAKGQFKLLLKRTLLIKLASLFVLFSMVQNRGDAFGYLSFLVFLHAGLYVVNIFTILGEEKISFKRLNLKRHLIPLSTILAMTLSTTIYTTLDSVLLGLLSDANNVGLYTAGVKLSKASLPIITSLGVVILPKASEYILKNNQEDMLSMYRKAFRFTALCAVPIVGLLFIYSKELILIFSGNSFIEATETMKILSALPLLVALGHLFSFQILIPYSKNKAVLYSTFLGMILFLFLSFSLMPKFGSLGAAIANISTELVVTCFYIFFIPRFIINGLPWTFLLKVTFCSAILIPIHKICSLLFENAFIAMSGTIILFGIFYLALLKYLLKEVLVQDLINLILNFGKKRT